MFKRFFGTTEKTNTFLTLKVCKGPGARATLGHMSVWFGEHHIVVHGSNSEYNLAIYSRS